MVWSELDPDTELAPDIPNYDGHQFGRSGHHLYVELGGHHLLEEGHLGMTCVHLQT